MPGPADGSDGPTEADGSILDLLRDGTLEPLGRLTNASNITLLCTASLDREAGRRIAATCVYKPIRGEAPLWDFPDGTLANREVAAFLVSEATGWSIVPPSVLRDGPYGPGLVQLWLDVDDGIDVVELIRLGDPALRPMAAFDAIVNNADRKAGHILALPGGGLRGVDHGVCFAEDPKLRTVLWAWMGTPFDGSELRVLERLRRGLEGGLGVSLRSLLAPDEVDAVARRLDGLLASGLFPLPDPDWPAIPWPWY